MTAQDGAWQQLGPAQAVYRNRLLTVVRAPYRLPDGSVIADIETLRRPDYVMVLPRRAGNLLLVRQYRPAMGRMELELPAGAIDPGETPGQAAARELLEETGHTGTNWQALGVVEPSPGYIAQSCHLFACDAEPVPGSAPNPAEITAVLELPVAEVLRLARSGGIRDMSVIAALFLGLIG